MKNNNLFQSQTFKGILYGIAILIAILLIFKAGLMIGSRKADFSCQWGENYHRNFAGPRQGFMQGFDDRDFLEANGVFGQIIKTGDSEFVIKGGDDIEKAVIIDDKTVVRKGPETIKPVDLKVDDFVVIIGDPNEQGKILAKLIRLMPAQPPMGQPKQPGERTDAVNVK